MQATEKHTARSGLDDRATYMQAIVEYAESGTGYLDPFTEAVLEDVGASCLREGDRYEDAVMLAQGYVYGVRAFYGEKGTDGGIIRAELLLAGGGPTHILTWDVRGAGWSEYFDSWADPQTCDLSEAAHTAAEGLLRLLGYEIGEG